MSDSDGDFETQLLELAGAVEKKRKNRQNSSSSKSSALKRRKTDEHSDSDDAVKQESEDEDINPYPLEGKYVDEEDRLRLLRMPEIEREDILSQRLEERQRIQDKRNLDQMLKAQNGGSDTVAKAAKRSHTQRGATKEKVRGLEELKAKRIAKKENKRTRDSPKRERSSSPMDMETSDDEDGQISKLEQEEEREQRLLGKAQPEDDTMTMDDLKSCCLTRDDLAKFCLRPWFQDYVEGAWVRYLIGSDGGENIYRICEVTSLGQDTLKPYKVNEQMVNCALELRHGKAAKAFPLDRVSNTPFTEREFDRLKKVCEGDAVKLPSKRTLEKKAAQIAKLSTQLLTESDVTAMIARKNQLQTKPSSISIAMQRSRLNQARTLALRRQDYAEVEEIDAKLATLAPVDSPRRNDDGADIMAKVNERNRRANLEAVRKAEALEAERKRREKKLAASGQLTPDQTGRSKRLLDQTSRNGTPIGTPKLGASGMATPTRSISPLPSSLPVNGTKNTTFESMMASGVEVDLGDF